MKYLKRFNERCGKLKYRLFNGEVPRELESNEV